MTKQLGMFKRGESSPLFSQTPQRGRWEDFKPAPQARQTCFARCEVCLDTGLVRVETAKHVFCTCEIGKALKKRTERGNGGPAPAHQSNQHGGDW